MGKPIQKAKIYKIQLAIHLNQLKIGQINTSNKIDIMQLQSMGSRMRVMEDLCRIIAFMNIEDGVFKIFEVSED